MLFFLDVFSLHEELNVDTAMGVIADFKNNKDWFSAFRWIPERKFRARYYMVFDFKIYQNALITFYG